MEEDDDSSRHGTPMTERVIGHSAVAVALVVTGVDAEVVEPRPEPGSEVCCDDADESNMAAFGEQVINRDSILLKVVLDSTESSPKMRR